ncbi:MAG: S-methyl-5-thioribose-1-phosphate isomerase [Myxococcales bacterium]|nr:S-methyl-5-thioribose-1-phosphate isomerase [Myxococcales bacterium]
MRVAGVPRRTIWLEPDGWSVGVIDQTKLPAAFETVALRSYQDVARAIRHMVVRGAPLIGAAAAYGLALALRHDGSDKHLSTAAADLFATRPTAINLRWALDRVKGVVAPLPPAERSAAAYLEAARIADEDVEMCRQIGEHGARELRRIHEARGGSQPLRVLTHCNAGWLATVDIGTALAPVYRLFDDGVPIRVWVDETRPRNQGYLTAWELREHGVPFSVIADNAGGHYLMRGEVDAVIVGSDRTTANGDVCNKIGTYLKALAAFDNGIPFFAAVPSSTIDFSLPDGASIPIEEREPSEVTRDFEARNPAFDVTPARLVTGIITERGVSRADKASLRAMFPDRSI